MIVGGILAGGIGSRMKKSDLPKQFMKLGDEPIILLTLKRLLSVQLLDVIYIAVHPQWMDYMERLLGDFCLEGEVPVRLVAGGDTRLESIRHLLDEVLQDFEVSEQDDILIHDSVRPFAGKEVFERSIERLKSCEAVGVAYPVNDTMFQILDGDVVSDMPQRDALYHGQTPDSFKILTIKRAMDQLTPDECSAITGTAQICMMKGIPIHTVPGDSGNIKITTDSDYRLACVMHELTRRAEQES